MNIIWKEKKKNGLGPGQISFVFKPKDVIDNLDERIMITLSVEPCDQT